MARASLRSSFKLPGRAFHHAGSACLSPKGRTLATQAGTHNDETPAASSKTNNPYVSDLRKSISNFYSGFGSGIKLVNGQSATLAQVKMPLEYSEISWAFAGHTAWFLDSVIEKLENACGKRDWTWEAAHRSMNVERRNAQGGGTPVSDVFGRILGQLGLTEEDFMLIFELNWGVRVLGYPSEIAQTESKLETIAFPDHMRKHKLALKVMFAALRKLDNDIA